MLRYFMKKVRNRKGFTLIELIVVIAILGILAAVAVPNYSGQQERAKAGTNRANMATIQNAVRVYEATTGKLPTAEADLETDDYLGTVPVPLKCTFDSTHELYAYSAATDTTFIMNTDTGVVSIGKASTTDKTIAISGVAK